jgi:hypothetical protein
MPIVATHDLVLAVPLLAVFVPPLAAVLLLLLLQPATASDPTAAAARTRRPFTGYASISREFSSGRYRSRARSARELAKRRLANSVLPPRRPIRIDDQTIAL